MKTKPTFLITLSALSTMLDQMHAAQSYVIADTSVSSASEYNCLKCEVNSNL